MPLQLQLDQFEGPYDLLLKLIKNKELDITELALSKVTSQYLEYVDELEEDRADELSDFLVVATKLLLLKSGEIIPSKQQEIDEQDLKHQLKVYEKFKEASEQIEQIWADNIAFSRKRDLSSYDKSLPSNLSGENLNRHMKKIIDKLEPPEPPPEIKVDETVSVKKKIKRIRELLDGSEDVSFKESINDHENKSELIAGFLALLELVKQYELSLSQEDFFGSINVEKTTA